jgi:hypothetical protein
MKEQDPTRLSKLGSEVPARLRDALGAARSDVPSAARVARIAARFPASGAPAAPGSAGTAGAPLPSALSGALVGAALGVVACGVGLLATTASPSEPRGQPVALAPQAATVGSPAAPLPPRATAELGEPPASPTVSPVPKVALPSAAHGSPPPSASAPEPLPAPPAAAPAPAVETGPVTNLAGEVQLLQRAQQALGANAAQALALTEEHKRRFPSGVLAQEREMVALEALVRLGRRDVARARAASFLAKFPESPHRRRIEAIVGP